MYRPRDWASIKPSASPSRIGGFAVWRKDRPRIHKYVYLLFCILPYIYWLIFSLAQFCPPRRSKVTNRLSSVCSVRVYVSPTVVGNSLTKDWGWSKLDPFNTTLSSFKGLGITIPNLNVKASNGPGSYKNPRRKSPLNLNDVNCCSNASNWKRMNSFSLFPNGPWCSLSAGLCAQ